MFLIMCNSDSQPSARHVTTPWFIATEKFDKSDDAWEKYIAWSKLEQLDELVSLDGILCPTVLPEIKPEYWSRIVNEDFMLKFFTDPDFLEREISGIKRRNFLCVFRNPPAHPFSAIPKGFEFVGYDLVDIESSVSALSNCGGFPDVFSNSELSDKGLLKSHERSLQVQTDLRRQYPHEVHANCHQWAIFRRD
jgi:hypothetical protein